MRVRSPIWPLTPEWFEARRYGIGSSEIAAVLGISPWESPFSLWWRKHNGWSDIDETEQMRTGTILEPAIARWAAGRITADYEPAASIHPATLLFHPIRPWQLATPDRVICDPQMHDNPFPGDPTYVHTHHDGLHVAVLECKWTGSWDGWGEDGTSDIPVHYRAQVQWQCDVLGVNRWYLAVLGPSGFRLYRGRRDDDDLAVMVEYGRRFMDRLERGDPPPVDDHTATIATLRRLHPDLEDTTVEVPEDVAAGYLRAVEIERKAKNLKAKYEARLREALGSARKAVTADGRPVATHVIADMPERTQTVAAHRRDYLLPPRPSRKDTHEH